PAERPPLCGRYVLISELGRGTSGVVYKAHDPKLDRLVALKILRPELVSLDESGVSLKQRFHQEAVAAGRLTHPAIVAVHDVGEAEGRPFMVMEYSEGGTLADLLLGGRPLPLADAVAIVVQVCAALDYAHRHGVVHRDIKPRNILVGPGVTKVTDFGTARILGASHTQTGTMLGTPAYMSPEMVRGQAADPRSDLFSLGVVLYETLTGVNPFNAADLAAVLYRIVNTDAPSVRRHNAELPLALDRVLRRALAKDPEARYATATDLANALRDAASSEQRTRTMRVLREVGRDVRRLALSRPIRVAAGLVCLLVLVGGTWSTFRRVTDVPRAAAPAPGATRDPEPAARPATPVSTSNAARSAAASASRSAAAKATGAPSATVTSTTPATTTLAATTPTTTAPVAPVPAPLPPAAERPTTPVVTATAPRPAAPAATPAPAKPVTPKATTTTVTGAATPASAAPAPVAATSQEARCLSVNALPFAEVYVDDRSLGYTPAACVRVAVGDHRVRFEMDGQRSPERVLRITARHTANAPMRISYDFNTGRFIEQ
ncbi:MAG TPA: serine/threonine-protein kinase, partial [Methylomirabilota bacterium]